MITIENNNIDIPPHLSVDFFQNLLHNGLKLSSVNVEKIVFQNGCPDGDSFTSSVYRANVWFSTAGAHKTVSFIIKCIQYEGSREVLRSIDVYGKEVAMYEKIIPKIEKTFKSKNISERIVPRMIYAQDNPVNTIVFEDLTALHFELADRINGLDETLSKMVLTKIGQFHAASMILARDEPYLMKHFTTPTIDEAAKHTIRDSIFRNNIDEMANLVDTWDGCLAQKLRKIKETFYDHVNNCVNNCDSFKVLNHGDLWVNNCMFKYNNDCLDSLFFIDFQLCYYGSPIFDLHYFLNTSVSLEVLSSKRYVLLRTYYDALKSTLETLQYEKIPTWDDLRRDVRNTEFIGFWTFEAFLPLLSIDKSGSYESTFGTADAAERSRKIMFSSKRFKETIKYALDRFEELGVFD